MAVEAPEAVPTTSRSRSRVRPSQVILIVGVVLAAVTALSGIVSTLTGWRETSPMTREIFGNIPSAVKAVFYTVLPVLFIASTWMLAQRAQNWERGQPDRR